LNSAEPELREAPQKHLTKRQVRRLKEQLNAIGDVRNED
jgi:hypothetical protein